MVPVVPIVAGLVSIDQGKRLDHPAAVPIVAGLVTSIDRGKLTIPRPCRSSPAPVVSVVPIVVGLVSIDRASASTIPRPCRSSPAPVVPVVSIVAGLVTSIDRASASTIPRPCRSSPAPVVSVVPIVAGLVSIDQGKRSTIPRPCRSSPAPVVPVVSIVAGLVTSIDRGKRLDHPAAVPIVAGPRGVRGADRCRPGEHRPGQAPQPVPRPCRSSPGPVVPVVSIVAGLVTSIDQGKRQPSPWCPWW